MKSHMTFYKNSFKSSFKCSLLLCLQLLVILPASATQLAGAHTYATRYNIAGQVTGTIAPDPDGSGPLKHAATRNFYSADGVLLKTEQGELISWVADETVDAKDWTGFVLDTYVTFGYDTYGRKVKETTFDKNNNAKALVQFNFDERNRLKCKAVRMNPAVYASLPDACAQSTHGTEGPDRISQFVLDDFDQVLTEKRAVGTPLIQTYVTNVYDGRLLTSQTDANGNRTEFRYDADFKWLKRQVFPSLITKGALNENDYIEFSNYDLNGNARRERKRSGDTSVITYEFDALNRKTKKNMPDASKSVSYGYDLRGLMTTALFTSNNQGITNVYDGFGGLKSSTVNMAGVSRLVRYNYFYNLNLNRKQIVHPDGHFFTYNYDGLNRISTMTDTFVNPLATFNYRANGRRQNIVRPNNTTTTYTFDSVNRLDNFQQSFPNTANNLTNSFLYNPASQITQLTLSNSNYSYTGNTNRTGVYVANNLNQYTSINGITSTYDGNGNLSTDNGTNYYYDIENRLISTSGTANSTFLYDPMGRLFQATVAGVATQFLYDGDALIAEYNALNGSMFKRYVHSGKVDEPIAQYTGGVVSTTNRQFLHADHQGSIIALTNVSGGVDTALAYDSFGIPAAGNSGRFGYTGQTYFKELGLNYYKARFYVAKLGRFLQTDPIGYKDNMNLYAYVGNDPINKNDPTGEYGRSGAIYGGIAGAVGGVVASGNSWREKSVGFVAGGIAGGMVGFSAPNSSGFVGLAITGAAASVAGQVAGSLINSTLDKGKDVGLSDVKTAVANISAVTTALGAIGAGIGGLVGQGAASVPATQSVIGSTVGAATPPTAVGLTAGAIVEGAIIGGAEAVAPAVQKSIPDFSEKK